VDLQEMGLSEEPPFDLFVRQKQKIWDGAPGIAFAYAGGLKVYPSGHNFQIEEPLVVVAGRSAFAWASRHLLP
jgi:hypothetical protein